MAPLEQIEQAYIEARHDPEFQNELKDLLANYAGRPTPLYYARRLSETLGGARIFIKREDLLHTGAHKINNCLGQALVARRDLPGHLSHRIPPDPESAVPYS